MSSLSRSISQRIESELLNSEGSLEPSTIIDKAEAEYQSKRAMFNWTPTTSFYVAESGSGSNPGTEAAPWDIAKVVSEFAARNIADYTEIRFNCGDRFQADATVSTQLGDAVFDTDGLTAIKFGAYGSGDLPWLTPVNNSYSSGWSLVGSNVYSRTEVDDVAWIVDPADPLTPYYLDGDSTLSDGVIPNTKGSFWYDNATNTLYVRMADLSDPNSTTLEAVVSNDWAGINLRGNLCYAHNIRSDFYGISRTNGVTQGGGIRSGTTGDNIAAAIECEAFYSASHVLHHNNTAAGTGGNFLVENCTSGFMNYPGGTGTVLNSYSGNGEQNFYSKNCRVKYGHLPASEWVGIQQQEVKGTAFLSHTSGTLKPSGRVIIIDLETPDNAWGCPNYTNVNHAPEYTDAWDSKVHIVGESIDTQTFEGVTYPRMAPWNGFRINPNIKGKSHAWSNRGASAVDPLKGEVWNGRFDLDVSEALTVVWGWVNATQAWGAAIFRHCDFILRNPNSAHNLGMLFDNEPTWMTDVYFYNCRFAIIGTYNSDYYWRGQANYVTCGFFNQNTRGTDPVLITNVAELGENYLPVSGDASFDAGNRLYRTEFNRNGVLRGGVTNLGSM